MFYSRIFGNTSCVLKYLKVSKPDTKYPSIDWVLQQLRVLMEMITFYFMNNY